MAGTILLKLLCSVVLLSRAATAKTPCKPAKCTPGASEIRSPLGMKALQPDECSLHGHGFTLLCSDNKTTIHLPGTRDLYVKTISYNTRKISLVDPQNCVHQVFLNLNLSLTPFRYYYDPHEYRYINCSAKVAGLEQVPCLSGSRHHVYVVEPSERVPVSCSSVKTVAIPFSYSPYLSGNSFGLALTWNIEADENNYYSVIYGVLSISGLIFIVAKMCHASLSKYTSEVSAEEMLRDVENEEFRGEYVALDTSRL